MSHKNKKETSQMEAGSMSNKSSNKSQMNPSSADQEVGAEFPYQSSNQGMNKKQQQQKKQS